MRERQTALIRAIAARLGAELTAVPGIVAIAMTGSDASGSIDEASDLDLNAYLTDQLPTTETRKRIYALLAFGRRCRMGGGSTRSIKTRTRTMRTPGDLRRRIAPPSLLGPLTTGGQDD